MPPMVDATADALDATRVFIYTQVADTGAPPTSDEIAAHFGISLKEARDRLRTLGATKRVIVSKEKGEIWMSGPFSALPTRFRVHGAATSWWANCAWDMLGIPASLSVSARVETSCACCDEPITIDVDADAGPLCGEGLVHIFLPARRWYEDIGYT